MIDRLPGWLSSAVKDNVITRKEAELMNRVLYDEEDRQMPVELEGACQRLFLWGLDAGNATIH